MTDIQAPPQVAYLRFIDDGLTFEGQVWRAGAVVATNDIAMASLDPLTQRAQWGVVMFEVISEEEYLALRDIPAQNLRATRRVGLTPSPPATAYQANGEPANYDAGKASPLAMAPAQLMAPPMMVDDPKKAAKFGLDALNADIPAPPEGNIANLPSEPPPDDPWPWYAEANDMQTVGYIATMGEASVNEFLAYEKANRNRASIVKVIETGEL